MCKTNYLIMKLLFAMDSLKPGQRVYLTCICIDKTGGLCMCSWLLCGVVAFVEATLCTFLAS